LAATHEVLDCKHGSHPTAQAQPNWGMVKISFGYEAGRLTGLIAC